MRKIPLISISLLLIFGLLALLGFLWYSEHVERRELEVATLNELERDVFLGIQSQYQISLPAAVDSRLSGLMPAEGVAEHSSILPEWFTHNIEDKRSSPWFRLTELALFNSSFDDSDIEALSKLKTLDKLTLHETRISYKGHRRLQAALPDTEITYNPQLPKPATLFRLLAGAGYSMTYRTRNNLRYSARMPLPMLTSGYFGMMNDDSATIAELFETDLGDPNADKFFPLELLQKSKADSAAKEE